jgi:hypothetical protein
MSLISVYFKEKNGKLKYTKCIIPKSKLAFFKSMGAVRTQAEAEVQNVPLSGNATVSSTDKTKMVKPKK